MSRRALFFSLALHAVVLLLAGRWVLSPGSRGGLNVKGAGDFTSNVGGLLVEIPPASAAENAPGPPPAPPEFSPPAPAPDAALAPLVSLTEKASPVLAPPVFSLLAAVPKSVPSPRTRTPHGGGHAAGAATGNARGSTGGMDGTGLAGAGRSGGGGPGYVPPQFRLRYKPPYPDEARAQRLEGTVILLVSLDSAGRVISATLERTCGHSVLDRAALKAVRSWSFDPARQNGVAIAAQVEVPVRFRFEDRGGSHA